MKIKIYLAGDHAGFKLKEKIKPWLEKNYEVIDLGPLKYNSTDDYPDYVVPLAKKISKEKNSFGIVFAGSGQGEAIAANRVKGVRATVFYGGSLKIIELSKKHNDANILSLGARFLTEVETKKAIQTWLKTKFSEEKRHKRRLRKIEKNT